MSDSFIESKAVPFQVYPRASDWVLSHGKFWPTFLSPRLLASHFLAYRTFYCQRKLRFDTFSNIAYWLYLKKTVNCSIVCHLFVDDISQIPSQVHVHFTWLKIDHCCTFWVEKMVPVFLALSISELDEILLLLDTLMYSVLRFVCSWICHSKLVENIEIRDAMNSCSSFLNTSNFLSDRSSSPGNFGSDLVLLKFASVPAGSLLLKMCSVIAEAVS